MMKGTDRRLVHRNLTPDPFPCGRRGTGNERDASYEHLEAYASGIRSGGMVDLVPGTGGVCEPMSEFFPAARVARFVRMTKEAHRRSCSRSFSLLVAAY